MTEIKPNQTYSWSPEDKIEITGIEYSILQKTLAMFEPGLQVTQAIFQRMLEAGVAKTQDETEQFESEDEIPFTPAPEVVDAHVPHVD